MARLNEPPIAGESLESLKRRFIRQNREITRANSAQSIRIRNLECETSRLLSENITLREQNIQLQRQVESTGNRQDAADRLHQIRSQLEAKLMELGGLVYELGTVDKKSRRTSVTQSSQSNGQTPKRSPDQRNWKNAFTLSDVTGQQEGRLPPILEDKLYPRRTLESADIGGIITDANDLTDSPDLGPPPVARFEDVISFRHDVNGEEAQVEPGLGFSSIARLNNLETRKKRRESSYTGSSLSDSVDVPPTIPTSLATPIPAQSLKSGAKRKFSARDVDEPRDAVYAADKDDFQFNRRAEPVVRSLNPMAPSDSPRALSISPSRTSRSLAGPLPIKSSRDDSATSTTSRKALGEKSVNNSPVKSKWPATDATSDPKKDASKKPKDREGNRSRSKSSASKPQRPSNPDRFLNPKRPVADSEPPAADHEPNPESGRNPEAEIEPTTAPLSPSTLAPSASPTPQPAPNTPPLPDLSATRPSRRQRGSVSYAEPNLRDKMRRPTRDLVDAVGGNEKTHFQRSASARAESEAQEETDGLTVVDERKVEKPQNTKNAVVKAEEVEEENWKDLPLAVMAKHGETNVGGEIPKSNEMGDTRPSGVDVPSVDIKEAEIELDVAKKATGSSAAIAALAGPGRAKSNRGKAVAIGSQDPGSTSQSVPNLVNIDISVPTSESNASTVKHPRSSASSAASAASRVIPLTSASRTSRRYSSVPEAIGKDVSQDVSQRSAQNMLLRTSSAKRKDPGGMAKKNIAEGVREIELRGGGVVAGHEEGKGGKGDRERERIERMVVRRKSMVI